MSGKVTYHQPELLLRVGVPDDVEPNDASGFTTPTEPDSALIQLIHRGHDGFISISRKNYSKPGDPYEGICNIPANSLPGLFEQLVPLTQEDSFFGINGFYRGSFAKNRFGLVDDAGNLLKSEFRKSEGLRYLTACWADLDCHNLGIEAGTVIGAVINAQNKGLIPPVSIFTQSGRGVWLFWILNGHDYSTPQPHARSYSEKVDLWAAIQGTILTKLSALGADANANDKVHITRIPGSINTKSGVRVSHWVHMDKDGKVPNYSLTELAAGFGVVQRVSRTRPAGQVKNTYQVRASKGHPGRWKRAEQNFLRLWNMRGGFGPGSRNGAVWVYSIILKSLNQNDMQIENAMMELFRSFKGQNTEPYTLAEMRATMKAAKRPTNHQLRNQVFADKLDISTDEVSILPGWKAASRFGYTPEPSTTLKKSQVTERRRRLIREFVERQAGRIPTGDELRDLIENAGLDRPAKATVLKDLKALGIENPRCWTQADEGDAARPLLPPE